MAHGIGNHRQFLALGFQLHLFRLTICWAAVGGGAIAILRHKHAEGLLTSPTSRRCIDRSQSAEMARVSLGTSKCPVFVTPECLG